MRDFDIRQQLKADIGEAFAHDPTTEVIDELGIRQALVRVDVAVVNGDLHGYEIKSAADSVRRLPRQVQFYSQVLDFSTLVTARGHVDAALEIVPEWWGLLVATSAQGGVQLEVVRRERRNPAVDPRALVELIWHEEAIELLRERNETRGVLGRPRRYAWDRLCDVFELDELRAIVRRLLKRRAAARETPPRR